MWISLALNHLSFSPVKKMDHLLWIAVIFAVLGVTSCSSLGSKIESNLTSTNVRHRREFPFYSLGRIPNTVCTGTDGLSGTCQIRGECAANGGIASGRCSTLTTQAVCCVYIGTCGGSGSNNITYFQNTGYPTPFNGGGTCTYTVVPPDNTICQLRVDFSALTLSQPSADGVCNVDNIQISGGSSPVPTICGDNNGQHVYVAFSGTSSISITVSTTASTSFSRVWNLQLSMISCTSAYAAPAGCLQYYLDGTGIVQSFNYGSAANPTTTSAVGTRQLVNLNYGICFRSGAGQCSITYTPPSTDIYAFTLSDLVTSENMTKLGTASGGFKGTQCTTDYLIIPNPTGLTDDRFCGMGIGATISNTTPFVLYYITNGDEKGDDGNRGFSFQYAQNACPISVG